VVSCGHRTLALGDRAVEPDAAMEGPPSAAGSTCQLMLEHLLGALLISGSWGHSPSLPVLPWAVLVWTVLLVLLVKRRLTRRSAKALGHRGSARHEVCGARREESGPSTQAEAALRPPAVVASPPSLQALCSTAMNTDPSRLVLRDTVNSLRKALKSQPPDLPQVPGEKPILRTSEKDGEQLLRKRTKDRSENTPFPEGPEPLNQDVSRWRQKGQEKEGEERLEPSKACMEPVPKDQASQSPSRAGPGLQAVPPPDLPAEHAGAGTRGVQPKRGAGNGDQPAHRAAVDLKGVPDDAGCPRSPPSPEGEQQHRARRLCAERREMAELTRQIRSLQTQEASLQKETSQLTLKLQDPPDEQDPYILQLHRKVFQAEAQCLEMKKKLASAHREMNFACQRRNLYKKMVQDLGKELERTTSYYRKLVLFHQDRATKSWVGAAPREREFQELRKENDRLRRMLAGVESSCRPVLRDPLGPAAPPTAHAGWEVSGGPRGHQAPRGDGRPTVRAPGPGVACKGDRAQGSWALSRHSPAQHLRAAP